MLAALGLFVFEAASFPFAELDRRTEWRHARAARIGAFDASQYVGPGADQVTIAGALVPEAGASYAAIDTLRRMADEGDIYQLVDGAGSVWGGFVIVGMEERRRHLMIDGTPRMIDFSLQLDRVA